MILKQSSFIYCNNIIKTICIIEFISVCKVIMMDGEVEIRIYEYPAILEDKIKC